VSIRTGISCFLTDQSVSIVDLAIETEARCFTELWVPEHTHIPTGRETDWPMEDGAELPEMYKRSMDPFIALTAAAMATTTLTLGTSICLVGQHDPIVLAKTISTLDHIANGRIILGVGFGWNEDEMRNHGVDPDRRRTIGREKVLAMKELWTKDEASFQGKYVDFSPSWQWPKPVQTPHPPVWVGGGKSTMKHAVEWGDGWMPIEGVMPVAKLTVRLRQMAEDAGRDPSEITVYLSGAPKDPAKLESYLEAGLDGIALGVSWDADLDTAKRELDENVEFRDRYLS
jgi:probable F420-dependent oxidoreductase